MGDSAITYLGKNGKSWSPIRGCSRVSEGCRNCWAERMAIRFAGWKLRDASKTPRTETPGLTHGLVRSTSSGPRWTGEVRLIEKDLDAPLRWRKPARIAVCFGGDLFHEKVNREWQDRIHAVMLAAMGHNFLVLTKRAEQMRAYYSDPATPGRIAGWFKGNHRVMAAGQTLTTWPMRNVRVGVSVENQATADERIPHLLATPAAVRWVSLEPLLGAVDVARWLPKRPYHFSDCPCLDCLDRRAAAGYPTETPYLSWVVLGCEQLPGRKAGRNAEGYLDHARAVIEQARAAGVPTYVKQVPLGGRVSHDPSEWSSDLRVQEMPR